MKRYIKSYSDIQQSSDLDREKQIYTSKIRLSEKLNDKFTGSINEDITKTLFDPIFDTELIDKYIEERAELYGDTVTAQFIYDSCGAAGWFEIGKHDSLEFSVNVFGGGRVNGRELKNNWGLEWLADLETGGDGSITCNQVSKLPSRIKNKLSEYKKEVEYVLESHGFEVLGEPNTTSKGFSIPVTNDEYESIEG